MTTVRPVMTVMTTLKTSSALAPSFGASATNLIASAVVSPIYVVVTNPLSRLEVIMQTNSIAGKSIPVTQAIKEMLTDMTTFGLAGIFRGQGIGIAKAIVSLSLFHEGRMGLARMFKQYNVDNGHVYVPPKAATTAAAK